MAAEIRVDTITSRSGINTIRLNENSFYFEGNVGIGTTISVEKLQVDGNIRVGISTTSNYIAFRGTFADGQNAGGGDQSPTTPRYSTTFIGERIYDYPEKSELLFFKGNDNNIAFGPDRIRSVAGEHRFDVIGFPTSGSFEQVAISTVVVNVVAITSTGIGIGTTSPTQRIEINSNTFGGLRINTNSQYPSIWFAQNGTDKWSITSNFNNDSAFVVRESTVADRLIITATGSVVPSGSSNAGFVGIGTTNPMRKLHVQSDQVVVGRFHSNNADGRSLVRFIGAATTSSSLNEDLGGVGIGINYQDFVIENTSGESLRITGSSRNVGIGLTNPAANTRLHIRDDNATTFARAIVQATDQRTIIGAKWESGVAQYAYIQGTNAAESTVTVLSLNPFGGAVGVGTSVFPNNDALLRVKGTGRFVGTMTDGGGGATLILSSHDSSGQGSIGGRSGIAFYSTFDNYPSDQGPRRSADIVAGFRGGTWGTQYLAFNVGEATNDPQNLTPERLTVYANGNVGIASTIPGSRLSVGGTITELYNGTYWNVVTQADVGIGASQVPLNQYLGQMAFVDAHYPSYSAASSTADAAISIDASSVERYSHIASFTADRTVQISNLTPGRELMLYLRNTNAASRIITIQASTTASSHANVNLAPGAGTMGAASVSTVTLAATSGTSVVWVANINGNIVGGLMA
jgi:hypothetical protein